MDLECLKVKAFVIFDDIMHASSGAMHLSLVVGAHCDLEFDFIMKVLDLLCERFGLVLSCINFLDLNN